MSTRPFLWKSLAPDPVSLSSPTFAAQSSLQKLPVPDLIASFTRLKESLKPIAWSDEEYAAAEKKIDNFTTSPLARELHARLLKRAQETSHWLEEWWDDAGYLAYRDSVVVNVSYYYGFDLQPSHLPQSPAARAAALTRAVMFFRQQLKRGLIRPDGTKDGPHCMDTYRWMFDCCRVPGPQGFDWSISYAKEGDPGPNGHIVVFRNNRVWKIDAAKDGKLLSTTDLEKQFQHIYDNSLHEYPGVGVLTASNRDVWAKDYAELSSSPQNTQIIHTIHSAAFVVCLDSSSPTQAVPFSRTLWHGEVKDKLPIGLRNRWVDKPVQFIVFDNAQAGIMGEHSVMDGTPTARLCDEVLDLLHNTSFDHGSPSSPPPSDPTPMDWYVSPNTAKAISVANEAAVALIESQVLRFHLTTYGKVAIKNFGVSPDSWAQMIVQLAYARFLAAQGQKRVGATYEAATTRRFFKGRTEAIRVVSVESDRWVASMDDESIGMVERKKLFSEAVKKHLSLAKNSGLGLGVDRYLFGLKKVLKEGEELPTFFSDPLVARSSYWILSTSSIYSKHFLVYGWGEVVPDGFGVAYTTGFDDRLQFTITSRKELPNEQFCKEIVRAAVDLYELHSRSAERATL